MRLVAALLLLSAEAGCHREPRTRPSTEDVPVFSGWEKSFDVPVEARFTEPSGDVVTRSGFASRGRFVVRYTPREVGSHSFVITAGPRTIARGTIAARPSTSRGFVHRDPQDAHRLVADDGSQFYILGENRINVYDPAWNQHYVGTAAYIERMARAGMTTIRVFLFSDCESEMVDGGYQIGCLEPAIGRFDEKTAEAVDELFAAAEKWGIAVVLVAYAIGFTPPPETWRSWVDNPYSRERGGPAGAPTEFFADPRYRADATKKLRYIADRWASSPALLAIDLLNEPEWDGPIPERTWIPWAEAMSAAWRSLDPYRHLVTAGSVGLQWNFGGDERPWYASGANDLVQWHLYGKQFYDPYALALEMARKVDETWGFGKPVFCGEFAYGGEAKPLYDHTHNGIWSLLFSGAGALAHSAPPFEIDSDEPMTPARAEHFRVLAKVIDSFDRKLPLVPAHDVQVTRGRAWSLVQSNGARAIWILGPRDGYGALVTGTRVTFPRGGTLTWLDDVTGEVLATSAGGEVPSYKRHVVAIMPPPSRGPGD
jgi:hypothetical protein